MNYLKAQWQTRTIHFELTQAQMYGDENVIIPIHWENLGEVFVSELCLKDLADLDWQFE